MAHEELLQSSCHILFTSILRLNTLKEIVKILIYYLDNSNFFKLEFLIFLGCFCHYTCPQKAETMKAQYATGFMKNETEVAPTPVYCLTGLLSLWCFAKAPLIHML